MNFANREAGREVNRPGRHAPLESATSAAVTGEPALPLLATKLTIPREPPALIDRPRLRDAVEAGLDKPVLLVSAGPGWGRRRC